MADHGRVDRANERTLRTLSSWLLNRRLAQVASSSEAMDQGSENSTQEESADDVAVKVELPWSVKEEPQDEYSAGYHACQRCSAVFMLPSSLEAHMGTFHGETLHSELPVASRLHGFNNNNADKTYREHGTLSGHFKRDTAGTLDDFVIKLEPSIKEELDDNSSAVHSTVQPMSDNTSGSLLSLNTSHVCQRCSATFVLFSSLALHVVTFHGEWVPDSLSAYDSYAVGNSSNKNFLERREDEMDYEDSDEMEHTKNGRSYICDVCGKVFLQLGFLERHIVVHTGEKLFECCKAFSSVAALRRHQLSHTERKPFVCDICNNVYTQADELKRHRMNHAKQRPFVCDVCNKGFTMSCHLKTHKLIHTSTKSFVCNICSRAFYRLNELNRHRLTHVDGLYCNKCRKVFSKASDFEKHKASHADQKPFVCDTCGKGFFQAYCLKRHERTHTGHKPFVCDVCNKAFVERFALKKHKLIHSEQKPYMCEVCRKGFTQSRDLKKHELTHIGHKPYVCDVCNKAFFGADNLKRHKLIHTRGNGHATYVCEVCNDTFVSPGDLKTHRLIHINLKPLACEVCTKVSAQADGLKRNRRDMAEEKLYKCPHHDNEDDDDGDVEHSSTGDRTSGANSSSSSGKVLVWAHPI